MEKQRKTVEGYRSDVQEIGISVAFILWNATNAAKKLYIYP